MSTNHTTNYALNQWEGTDKVLRAEFNADNAKIDAALKANADAIAAEAAAREALAGTVALKGNCRIVYGTYTGMGAAAPTVLTFDGKPLAVFIMSQTHSSNNWIAFLPMIRGAQWTAALSRCAVAWSDNAVSWSCPNDPQSQFASGVYYYIAFLAADE